MLIFRCLNPFDRINKEHLSIKSGDMMNGGNGYRFVGNIDDRRRFQRYSTSGQAYGNRRFVERLSDREIMKEHIKRQFAYTSNSPNYQFVNKLNNEYGYIIPQNQSKYPLNNCNKQFDNKNDSLITHQSNSSSINTYTNQNQQLKNNYTYLFNRQNTPNPNSLHNPESNESNSVHKTQNQNHLNEEKYEKLENDNKIKNKTENVKKKQNQQFVKISNNISMEIKFINLAGVNKGQSKINQDSVLINKFKSKDKTFYIFAVFDGHGKNGHHVSKYLKSNFTSLLKYQSDKEPGHVFNPASMPKLLKNCCTYLDKKIVELDSRKSSHRSSRTSYGSINSTQMPFDASLSGSTCSMIILTNNMLWSLSIGDSKSILIFQNIISSPRPSLGYYSYPISKIHSTDNLDEIRRVKKQGGVVKRATNYMYEPYGPLRVWNSKGKMPGLQVTRSFGDLIGKNCGVSAVPDILDLRIKDNTKAMIIATDGLWDMVSERRAIEVIKENGSLKEINKAIIDLRNYCVNKWKKTHNEIRQDDISIILVYFHQNY